MRELFNSLKSRLFMLVFIPISVVSVFDLIVTYSSSDKIATLVQEQILKGSAKIMSEQASITNGDIEISIPPAAFEIFSSPYQDRIYFAIRQLEGKLIAGSDEIPAYTNSLALEQAQYYSSILRGEPVHVVAYAHALSNGTDADVVVTQIAQTKKGQAAFRQELFMLAIRKHALLMCIVLLGLLAASRWSLRPLLVFSKKVTQRQSGSLEKINLQHVPTELLPVTVAINDYVTRLDQTLSSYEQFVASSAHQLRTTFAIITSQLNFARHHQRSDHRSDQGNKQADLQSEILDAIQNTVAQGSKVINQLLILARLERTQTIPTPAHPTVLADIVKQVMDELAPIAQQKNIELGTDGLDHSVTLVAPAYLLHEMVLNVVENAILHMGQAGVVTISVFRKDAYLYLRIVDNGPGIPAAERSNVIKRFYRIETDRATYSASSGLGLAIVAEIVQSLNGRLILSEPRSKRGLQVDIKFPNG
ncbi:sensor histidine kinase [Sapientia aquatica]|uniref:histidine kinase n=2 Tax=Sapientia aquatica TaxID=1549640 RepID=A0A4R5W6Y8_9BURK|nr:sensor histidine kinase [Sapientia aquatica]